MADPNLAAPRDAKVREALVVALKRTPFAELESLARKLRLTISSDDGSGVLETRVADALLAPREARGEPVLWAVYDTHGRMMTYTESRTKADAERARYEGYGDDVWIANRPFTVVPLYAAPLPAERGREDRLEAFLTGALLIDCEACAQPHADEKFYDAMARDLRTRLRAALSPDAGRTT